MNRRVAWPPLLFLLGVTLGFGGGALAEPGPVLEGFVRTEAGDALDEVRVYVSRNDVVVAEAVADDRGRFRVELEKSGPVDVRVGKACSEWNESELRKVWFTLTAEALVAEPGREPVELVVARDADKGQVRVRVTSSEGYVSSALVRTWPSQFPPEAERWWPFTHTNNIGRADCGDLPLLPATIHVQRTPPWCPAVVRDVLPDPLGVDLHRIQLERERILRGRVLDEAGEPVAGVGVMATREHTSSARAWGDVTGLDGVFLVGVPESWERATLLVGCAEPREDAPHRLALEIDVSAEAAARAFEVVLPSAPAEATIANAPGDEARRVMETVLREHYVEERMPCLVLLRQLEAYVGRDRNPATHLGEDVQASTRLDVERKAEIPATVPTDLDVGVRKVFLDTAWNGYIHDIHGMNDWRHFYWRFPKPSGLVVVSRVGFSEDGTQAVLHVAQIRWRRNADGYYYLLEKRGGAWRIVKRVMTWIS